MSSSPSAENLLLGAGNVYFDRLVSPGVWDVSRHLGNCSSFMLNTEVIRRETNNLKTKITDLNQQKFAGFKVTGRIVLDEITKENLALLLAGSVDNSYEQPNIIDAVQAYTVTKNMIIKIGHGYLSSSIGYNKRIFGISVSSVKTGATTYREGRDYTVNKSAGLVFISADSTIPNSTNIEITLSAISTKIPQISIANNTVIAGQITFVGDPVSGPAYMCSVKQAELTFDGGVSLIGEEFTSLVINFVVTAHDVNALDLTTGYYNVVELPKVE